MKRRTFVASLLALIAASVAWVFPKRKEPTYNFTKEDVGPWLKRCGGCGDFFPDTKRSVLSGWKHEPYEEVAAYSHGNHVCIGKEHKLTQSYYQIHTVSSKDCRIVGYDIKA